MKIKYKTLITLAACLSFLTFFHGLNYFEWFQNVSPVGITHELTAQGVDVSLELTISPNIDAGEAFEYTFRPSKSVFLSLEVRLTGPSRLVDYIELNSSAQTRHLIKSPQVPGLYAVEVVLLYNSFNAAYPTPGSIVTTIAANTVFRGPRGSLPLLNVGRPRKPLEGLHSAYSGYWKRSKNGKAYVWNAAVKLPALESDSLKQCLRDKSVLLVGDSHTRKWYELLESLLTMSPRPKRWFNETRALNGKLRYYSLRGIFFTHWPRSASFYEPNSAETLPRSISELDSIAINKLPAAIKEMANSDVYIVANAGHWDLRDWPVDTFCSDVNVFLNRLAHGLDSSRSGLPKSLTVMLRTLVPYAAHKYPDSQRHKQSRDYRTVSKFYKAKSQCYDASYLVKTLVGYLSPRLQKAVETKALKVVVLDSFGLLNPVREATCDSVHYLCAELPNVTKSPTIFEARDDYTQTPVAVDAGIYDFRAFQSALCKP